MMKPFLTKEGTHYRRWVNLIPSLILPGSAQFLSGRKAMGIAFYMLYHLMFLVFFGFFFHHNTSYSIFDMGPFGWLLILFWIFIFVESLRRPIPRMGFRGWGVLLVIYIGIPILLALPVRIFLLHPFKISTESMQPKIIGKRNDTNGRWIPGDRIVVNKLIYRLTQPQRGDVIVFSTKGLETFNLGKYNVRRMVGLPGETIGIEPPYLLVNEKKVMEPEIFRRIAENKDWFSGFCPARSNSDFSTVLDSPSARITLGTDEYFVLGDNTLSSIDSRYYGPIKRSAIIGKAVYIFAPAERKRVIE